MAKAPTGGKAPTKNEVATTSGNGNLPANIMDDLHSIAGEGMERVGIDDVIMPRMKLLQDLSPEVKDRRAEYIEGARPGMICNVATRMLYESIGVVPCAYIRHHIEWQPNRGGFVADHGDDPSIMERVTHRDDKHFDILDNGNIIQPTPTWYCINLSEGGDPCVIPMPRTQSKASRQWMSQATSEKLTHPEQGQFTAPLFYRAWDLTPVMTSNDDGEWFIWSVKRGPSILDKGQDGELILPPDTMAKAQAFRKMVTSGEVRASAEHFADDEAGGGRSRRNEGDDAPM